MICSFIASGLAAYLLGAVPFGYIVGRLKGVDIRTLGSGNIGATNVARCLGKGWGALVFFCDALKGFLPAWLFPVLANRCIPTQHEGAFSIMCAVLAVAGHNWPVYLRFKGGKGIATSLGALVGIAPACAGIGAVAWFLVFGIARYVSVASISAAATVAVAAWILHPGEGVLLPSVLTMLAAVAVWRHKANIKKLAQGTEYRFQFRSPTGRVAEKK